MRIDDYADIDSTPNTYLRKVSRGSHREILLHNEKQYNKLISAINNIARSFGRREYKYILKGPYGVFPNIASVYRYKLGEDQKTYVKKLPPRWKKGLPEYLRRGTSRYKGYRKLVKVMRIDDKQSDHKYRGTRLYLLGKNTTAAYRRKVAARRMAAASNKS